MKLEPTISTLTDIGSVHRANRDSDGQRIRKCIIVKPKLHNNRKSKISITDLYEFMWHMHECQVNIVYQYILLYNLEKRPNFIGLERSRGQSIYCHIHWLARACPCILVTKIRLLAVFSVLVLLF